MLRPGGFFELNPQQQKLFDKLKQTFEKIFEAWGYEHIHTPAVEKNKVLLAKWGDEVSWQIYWLFGLKQGCQDQKDFSLHYDLTVPLARYVIDHRWEINLPFKRYQIQPVWRGERQQKWRFREFWQADVDIIFSKAWGAEADAQVILVLMEALVEGLKALGLQKKVYLHINHKGLLLKLLEEALDDKGKLDEVLKLFDKYHKMPPAEFEQKLAELVGEAAKQRISQIVDDYKQFFDEVEEGRQLRELFELVKLYLQQLGLADLVEVKIDPTIVRGLDYYTWMVFETFLEGLEDFWSVASGGRYDGLTSYIEPSMELGGVGGSIGISRLFSLLEQELSVPRWQEQYLIVNFGRQNEDVRWKLYKKLRDEGAKVEIYPFDEKLKKQLKYADKRWIKYVVIAWEEEIAKGKYLIKDLQTWEQKEYEI